MNKVIKGKLRYLALIACAIAFLFVSCNTTEKPPVAQMNAQTEVAIAKAWDKVWNDDFKGALKDFATINKSYPSVPSVERGLGLANFALGRVFDAEDQLIASILDAPDDPESLAVRSFIDTRIPYNYATQKALSEVDALLAGAKRPVWVQRVGQRQQLEKAIEIDLDSTAAATFAASLGTIKGWKLLGPLPNISGYGFDREYLDEALAATKLSPDIPSDIVDWYKVAWVNPSTQEIDGMVNLGDRFQGSGGSAYYAATSVSVSNNADYWIVVDRDCAFKLWVDGAQIISDPRNQAGSDLHWIRISLKKGSHKFFVKVGDDTNYASFRISLVPASQNAQADDENKTAMAGLYSIGHEDGDPIIAKLAILAANEGTAETRFWLSSLLSDKGYTEAALSQLVEARKLIGAGTFTYATLIQESVFQSQKRTDLQRSLMVTQIGKQGIFAPAAETLIYDAYRCGRLDEAVTLIAQYQKAFGSQYRSLLYSILVAAENGVNFNKYLTSFSNSYSGTMEIYAKLLSGSSLSYSIARSLNSVKDVKFPLDIETYLAYRLYNNGVYSGALRHSALVLNTYRSNGYIWSIYLDTMLINDGSTYDVVEQALDRLIVEFPNDYELANLLASVSYSIYYQASNSKASSSFIDKEANRFVAALKAILRVDPSDFSARETIREFTEQKSIESYVKLTDTSKVIDDYIKATATPPATDVAMILDEETDIFFGDGGMRIYVQNVMKILSREGVRQESSQDLGFDPLYSQGTLTKAILRKANGTQQTVHLSGSRVSFPGLEVGDYIILSFYIDAADGSVLGPNYWTRFNLNSGYPTFKRNYSVIYPTEMEPKVTIHNADGFKIINETKKSFTGYSEMNFNIATTDAVEIGAAMPDWRDTLAWVDLSSVSDWTVVADWYRILSQGRCTPSPKINELVQQLTVGLKDREQIIAKLYDYASNKINYTDLAFQYSNYTPQRPDKVIEYGYGDCKDKSTLLVSMLRSAGVEAWIALSDPDYSGKSPYMPSPRFSHAIVYIPKGRSDGGDLVLDPTTAYFTYPEFPTWLDGTYFLPIAPDGKDQYTGLVPINGAKQMVSELRVDIVASETSSKVTGKATYHGIYGASIRSLLQSGDPLVNQANFSLFIAEGIPGFSLAKYSVSNLDNILAAPVAEFTGTAPSLLVNSNGFISLGIPWFVSMPKTILDYANATPRNIPFSVDYSQLQSPIVQKIVIELPDAYRTNYIPENATFKYGDAYASYRFTLEGKSLVCERTLFVPRMTIAVSELAAFKKFLSSAAAKELETVFLTKK